MTSIQPLTVNLHCMLKSTVQIKNSCISNTYTATMTKFIIQGLFLLIAAALMAEAMVSVGVTLPNGRRRRGVEIQGLPDDCQAEVDVEKRDGSEEVDFVVCVKSGEVCTSRDVPACSGVAELCESFKPPADQDFAMMFPNAYAQVCEEPTSKELCLYTDVEYETCDEAKTMNENEICITLSNGEVECSEIPLKYRLQSQIQSLEKLPPYRPTARVDNTNAKKQFRPWSNAQSDDKLPQYRPTARKNGDGAKKQYWPRPY